jgi:hypothetical protein
MSLIVLGLIIAWWGWKSGGYFEVTFLPGTIALLGVLGALLFSSDWPGSIRSPFGVALAALIGLGAWILVSALWSPSPAVAVADSQRIVTYAVAFALGTWLCLLVGERVLLSLSPLAVGGGLVAVATLIALWTGSSSHDFFELDGTLRYPIGYRNAEAAFFLMATFPMLVLAASRELDWRLRGGLVGLACLSIELVILAESRASLFALVFGIAALLAAHPARLRILAYTALAAAPAAIALPWLLEPFQHGAGNMAGSIAPLHAACRAMAATTVGALAIGFIAVRLDPAVTLGGRTRRAIGGGLLGLLAAAIAAGLIAIALSAGGLTGFVSRHANQLTQGSPDLTSTGTRFGLDFRTERGDLWRVAREDFADHPIGGTGSGGFYFSYEQHRRSDVEPEDPHSVELLMASELGIPGILLFATFAIAALTATLRARRLGTQQAALVSAGLGIGAYWFVHASVDWFWSYPVITLMMAYAIGAAGAPAIRRSAATNRSRLRVGLIGVAAVLALSMLPFFFSARYADSGVRIGTSDPGEAYAALHRAADLNPLSNRPLTAEAVIAESTGDRARALSALREAESRVPDDWLPYYMQASVLATKDPAGAARALERARALNPLDPEIDALAKKLGLATASPQ